MHPFRRDLQPDVRQGAQREERLALGELVEEVLVVGRVEAVVDAVDAEVEDSLADPVRWALFARVHREAREVQFARERVDGGELGGCGAPLSSALRALRRRQERVNARGLFFSDESAPRPITSPFSTNGFMSATASRADSTDKCLTKHMMSSVVMPNSSSPCVERNGT